MTHCFDGRLSFGWAIAGLFILFISDFNDSRGCTLSTWLHLTLWIVIWIPWFLHLIFRVLRRSYLTAGAQHFRFKLKIYTGTCRLDVFNYWLNFLLRQILRITLKALLLFKHRCIDFRKILRLILNPSSDFSGWQFLMVNHLHLILLFGGCDLLSGDNV